MIKAVFLDRDGVINQKPPEGEYVTCWEGFHVLPGVIEGIGLLNRAGFSVIVVTNQRCIAKGLMTEAELENLHERMIGALAQAGATIDGAFYCPHEIEPLCECRKPAPGMLLTAARSHGIDLRTSWMIGDSEIDVEAGMNAGCKTARLLATSVTLDETARASANTGNPDIIAQSLLDAIRQILQWEGISIGSLAAGLADIGPLS